MSASDPESVPTPPDHQHHHDRGELHDPDRFFARFLDTLDVLPPEVESHAYGEHGSGRIRAQNDARMKVVRAMKVFQYFVKKSGEVLSGGNPADRAGKNVVEHQRGY